MKKKVHKNSKLWNRGFFTGEVVNKPSHITMSKKRIISVHSRNEIR